MFRRFRSLQWRLDAARTDMKRLYEDSLQQVDQLEAAALRLLDRAEAADNVAFAIEEMLPEVIAGPETEAGPDLLTFEDDEKDDQEGF